VTVEPGTTLRQLVEDYIYRYHHELFPVATNGQLVGCVGTAQVKQVPTAAWERTTVGEVALPCTPQNTVRPDADAVQALAQMQRQGTSRLLVAEDGHIAGIVALKDLLGFLSAKLDLEGVS
jgi:predicted transcriptional regulator